MEPVRVLIVDDGPAMRMGLRAMLSSEPSIQVVGEADGAFGAVEQAAILRPHVVLLDARMPRGNAAVLASRLRQRQPNVKLVFLVDPDHDGPSGEIPAGADAYLVNSTTQQKLTATVLAVHGGQRAVDPDCAGRFLKQYESAVRELAKRRLGLSDQEIELLEALAMGATNREIAARMYLSEITVIRKVQQVVAKLGASNRTQAVAEAVRRCII